MLQEIEPNVFLGSSGAGGNPALLAPHGITDVIHIGYDPLERTDDITYHAFSFDDSFTAADDMVRHGAEIVNLINTLRGEGRIVLVSCLMGRSRSASMMVLWLHTVHPALSYRELVALISKKRTISINLTFADRLQAIIDTH